MDIKRPLPLQKRPADAKLVFKGQIFNVYQWQQQMFDGSYETFEQLTRPDTVVVIPVTDDGNIILLNEEQPGHIPTLNFPGGRIDEGESPLEAAKRELKEETGYEAREMMLLDAVQPYSKIDWIIYTFIAYDARRVADPHTDKGEKISLQQAAFDEFVNLARSAHFRNVGILVRVYEALLDQTKYQELKTLLSPK